MNKVEVVYKHPNPKVMAQGPRILDFTPPGKPKEYYEAEEKEITLPGMDKSVVVFVYTFDPTYARRLLASQPERYFLLSPKKLIVPIRTQNGLRTENKVIRAITEPPIIQPIEPVVEEEVKEPSPGFHPAGNPLRPTIAPKQTATPPSSSKDTGIPGHESPPIEQSGDNTPDIHVSLTNSHSEAGEAGTVSKEQNPFERPFIGEQ